MAKSYNTPVVFVPTVVYNHTTKAFKCNIFRAAQKWPLFNLKWIIKVWKCQWNVESDVMEVFVECCWLKGVFFGRVTNTGVIHNTGFSMLKGKKLFVFNTTMSLETKPVKATKKHIYQLISEPKWYFCFTTMHIDFCMINAKWTVKTRTDRQTKASAFRLTLVIFFSMSSTINCLFVSS